MTLFDISVGSLPLATHGYRKTCHYHFNGPSRCPRVGFRDDLLRKNISIKKSHIWLWYSVRRLENPAVVPSKDRNK